MDYIYSIQQESDKEFQCRLEGASAEARKELIELREGFKKRRNYMESTSRSDRYFDTNSEKVTKIKEWYPRVYSSLVYLLPNFIAMPDQMPKAVLKLANDLVQHCLLPDDQFLLAFC